MIALAHEKGLFLMEAMWTRFLPSLIHVRELIDAGTIGDYVDPVFGQMRRRADP